MHSSSRSGSTPEICMTFSDRMAATNTIRACDYVSAPPPQAEIKFNDIDIFFAHLGQERLTKPKFSLDTAKRLGPWLDQHWGRWCALLSSPYKEVVDSAAVCKIASTISVPFSATNQFTSTSTQVRTVTIGPSWQAVTKSEGD